MTEFAAIALLALALGDSLPYRPLLDADSDKMAWTVEQYMDSTVVHWRFAGEVVPVIESPGEGEVLVLIVPLAGEDQSTGVGTLPPASDADSGILDPRQGWCGRLFSIDLKRLLGAEEE